MSTEPLPPLPRPFVPGDEASPCDFFVAEQMHAYARQYAASLEAENDAIQNQTARWAIDGAIAKGLLGIDPPPTTNHWLMEYWQIGRRLASFNSRTVK